ncbi:ribosomal RNA Processing 5 isoform X2 [Lycorma delicatula]|uniref:ribosomal RNA Processing 5 isoform X2 n=1 Tax=Lycorma delicatula TaxID=130591 RepID=UPI003F510A76
MASDETYFPRGPVKISEFKHKKTNVQRKDSKKPLVLFKRLSVKKKHEQKRERFVKKQSEKSAVKLNYVTPLLYETLQEGFVVAGCVWEVYSTQMTVTLPGRLVAYVKINKISTPYSALLLSYTDGQVLPEDVPTLRSLYKAGDLVTCCVESVSKTERGSHRVLLSLNPSDINRDKREQTLEENVVLVGAVKSMEDHGYSVDLGIEGVTAFLPFKRVTNYYKTQNIESLPIGKVIQVAVRKVLRANVGTTAVELTLEPEVISKAVPCSGFTIDNLTPGNCMNVFIKQILPNGVEVSPVHAVEEFSSYVHIAYVRDLWGSTSELLPGKVFTATFLYSLTPVNLLYFSLKSYARESDSGPSFKDGTIINKAQVIATAASGAYLQLGAKNLNAKGFVSPRQAGDVKHFSVGETYKTRILNYDYMEKVYICSLNKDVLSAEVFSIKDLCVGQTVNCTVTSFKEGFGLNLKLGTLTAFVPLSHLSDHPHRSSKAAANLYKPNSIVTGKVLQLNDSNDIIVTLKPTLVSSEPLCDYANAVPRKSYYGTINKIVDAGIVVRFFGSVFGFVPNRLIAPYVTGLSKESFHVGQLIRCYVVNVNPLDRKLNLSLIPDAASDLKLGTCYSVDVIKCSQEGLEVVTDTNISGFIPIHQVTDHLSLLNSFLTFYSPGKSIQNALLYSFTEDLSPYFTLRSSVKEFLQANPLIFSRKMSDLSENMIVPCNVKTVDDSGLYLNVTVPGYPNTCFISKEDCCDDLKKIDRLKENQTVFALASPENDFVKLDISSSKFIGSIRAGVEIVDDFLNSARTFQDVAMGSRVNVKVVSVTEDVVTVKLLNKKMTGSFRKELSNKIYKKNDKLEAVVLWQDPDTKHVFVHPDSDKFNSFPVENISEIFTGSVGDVEVLLLCDELVVGVILSGLWTGMLTFIPCRTHFNDFSCKKPSLLSNVQVIPCIISGGVIISERIKRIKQFSKQLGVSENEIVSMLLGFDINKLQICNKNNVKKKRKSLDSSNPEVERLSGEVVDISMKKKLNSKNCSVSEISYSEFGDEEHIGNSEFDNSLKYIKIRKKKRKNSEASNEAESCVGKDKKQSIKSDSFSIEVSNKNQFGNCFEISHIDDSGNENKTGGRSNNAVICNGFNISYDISQNEDPCQKKGKKRKKSDFNSEEVSHINSFNNTLEVNKCHNGTFNEESEHSFNSSAVSKEINKSKKLKKPCNDNSVINYQKNSSVTDESHKKGDKHIADRGVYDDASVNGVNSKGNEKPRLSLSGSGKFFWNVEAKDFTSGIKYNENKIEDENDDDDDDDDEKHNRPKTSAEKKAAAKEAEKRLRQAEQQLLEAETNPQSADHFERLTLAQPNNSLIWVKYMAYHLQATEIEKAKAVANRALKTIGHREEQERLNVWIALLNLENLYGTEESLKKALEEAVRTNDEYLVLSKMAEIYCNSKKNLELDQLTTLMVRKFKNNLECWLLCCRCLLMSKMIEKARAIFQKGLQSIMKKEHVQYITRFALLENTHGSPEHAQTLMEHVLTTYPGRTPTWITYIDMLTKSGRIDLARNVLERAVSQKLPVKKMKTLYKKWLQFEQMHGSEESVNHVREAAENYVNSLSSVINIV